MLQDSCTVICTTCYLLLSCGHSQVTVASPVAPASWG